MKMTELACVIEIAPEFHDLDPMGIVWHGNYAKYLERARCVLLGMIEYDYPQMKESGYAWPIVEMRSKYVRPLTYRKKISLRATMVEWEHRLKIQYLMKEPKTGSKIHEAYTIQVAVCLKEEKMCFRSPSVLQERLEKYGINI